MALSAPYFCRSASTLSMSSSSSLGSLSSSKASSKGSLSSLSFTDIYGLSSTTPSDPNMLDLHRRVEKILMGSSPNSQQPQQHQNPRIFQHQVSVPELNCIGESENESDDKRQQQQLLQQQQQPQQRPQLRLNSSRSSSSSLLSSPQQQPHDPTNSYFSFNSNPPPYTSADRKSLILPHLATQVSCVTLIL